MMSEPNITETTEWCLSSQRVVTPKGERAATVHVRDEQIVSIEEGASESADVILGDIALLPGLIDPHVHLNEPGRAEWEGFLTGTAAAAAGGVTTLVDMPLNSSPVTTSVAALQAKRTAAEDKLSVDVGFYAGLVPGAEAQMPGLIEAGVRGVKAFLCHSGLDEFPAATERELRTVMPLLAEKGLPLLVHAELTHATPPMADPRCYADYLATRPESFERDAIRRMIGLCEETGCRTHIVHLADAGSLPMLAEARAKGLPLTVETCPHYLTFAAEEIAEGATEFKCAPPIRSAENREGLWQGLANGTIDFIATDHSPCPPEMKAREQGRFDEAWGGVASLGLALPIIWTEAAKRGHDLAAVVRWLHTGPAKLLGLPDGIRTGAPANLVAFDSEASFVVDADKLLMRHKLTPYAGRTFQGTVEKVYLRGKPIEPGRGRTL